MNPSSASSKIHGGVGLYDQDRSFTGMKKKITKHIDIPTNPQNPKIRYNVYYFDIFVFVENQNLVYKKIIFAAEGVEYLPIRLLEEVEYHIHSRLSPRTPFEKTQ